MRRVPFYGIMLDELRPGWREKLKTDKGFYELAIEILPVPPATNLKGEALRRSQGYHVRKLFRIEDQREQRRLARLDESRRKYVDGSVLKIALSGVHISFDPRTLEPFELHGTVYPTMRAVDVWGILTVTDGALLDEGWSVITVVAPSDPTKKPLAGDGWTLELKEGWVIQPGPREGDYMLVRAGN